MVEEAPDVPMKPQKDSTGLSIDHFELLKVIGTGSYGKVMLCRKKDESEVYAIKMLNKKHLIKKN